MESELRRLIAPEALDRAAKADQRACMDANGGEAAIRAVGPQISFIGFTLARILHGPFYVLGMQPHRTIAFGVGWLLMLWMVLAAFVSLLTLP